MKITKSHNKKHSMIVRNIQTYKDDPGRYSFPESDEQRITDEEIWQLFAWPVLKTVEKVEVK